MTLDNSLPESLQPLFTSYYEGALAARFRTLGGVVDTELKLFELKRSYQTKQIKRKERGRVITEFVVRLLD